MIKDRTPPLGRFFHVDLLLNNGERANKERPSDVIVVYGNSNLERRSLLLLLNADIFVVGVCTLSPLVSEEIVPERSSQGGGCYIITLCVLR